ncbi:MAG: acyl carrier protein [Betaproteobacteria bacterium]|nr:acyl carrier protein [Betaproteobacteria bacterium]
MTTEDDLLDVLKRARIQIPPERFRTNQPLVDQGVDSLEMAVLMLELEKKFSVSIPTDMLGRLRTLDDISHFLDNRPVGAAEARKADSP